MTQRWPKGGVRENARFRHPDDEIKHRAVKMALLPGPIIGVVVLASSGQGREPQYLRFRSAETMRRAQREPHPEIGRALGGAGYRAPISDRAELVQEASPTARLSVRVVGGSIRSI